MHTHLYMSAMPSRLKLHRHSDEPGSAFTFVAAHWAMGVEKPVCMECVFCVVSVCVCACACVTKAVNMAQRQVLLTSKQFKSQRCSHEMIQTHPQPCSAPPTRCVRVEVEAGTAVFE